MTVSVDFGADADLQRSDDGVWTVTVYPRHGFATNQHSWHRYGRAIAPFLVVMPLGHGGAHVNGNGTGIAPQGADGPVKTRRCTSGTCWRTSSR